MDMGGILTIEHLFNGYHFSFYDGCLFITHRCLYIPVYLVTAELIYRFLNCHYNLIGIAINVCNNKTVYQCRESQLARSQNELNI